MVLLGFQQVLIGSCWRSVYWKGLVVIFSVDQLRNFFDLLVQEEGDRERVGVIGNKLMSGIGQ